MGSVAPFTPVNAPPLGIAFRASLAAAVMRDFDRISSDNAAAKIQESEKIDTLDFKPGPIALATKLANLIKRGQPDKALDLIVSKSHTPEMHSIAHKIHDVFKDYGYKEAAKEMESLLPEISAPKISAPTHANLSKFIM